MFQLYYVINMTENQDAAQLVSIAEQIVQSGDVDGDVVRFSQGRFRAVIDYTEDEFRLFDSGEEVICGGLDAFRSD